MHMYMHVGTRREGEALLSGMDRAAAVSHARDRSPGAGVRGDRLKRRGEKACPLEGRYKQPTYLARAQNVFERNSLSHDNILFFCGKTKRHA